MIKKEVNIPEPKRYTFQNEVPLSQPFSFNKTVLLFDTSLHQCFFISSTDRKKTSEMFKFKFVKNKKQLAVFGDFFRKKSSPVVPKKKPFSSGRSTSSGGKKKKKVTIADDGIHRIDYENENVKEFIEVLNGCLSSKCLREGISEEVYEKIWKGLTKRDNATVAVTLLLGRLLKMEIDAIAKSKWDDRSTKKLFEVIDFFQPNEVDFEVASLLLDRGKSIETKVHVNSDMFGSFLQVYEQIKQKKFNIFNGEVLIEEVQPNSISGSNSISSTASSGSNSNAKDDGNSAKDDQGNLTTGKIDFSDDLLLERSSIVNLLLYITSLYDFDYQENGALKVLNEWKKIRHGEGKYAYFTEKKKKSVVTLLVDTTHKSLEYLTDFHLVNENERFLTPNFNLYCPSTMFDSYNLVRVLSLTKRDPKFVLGCYIQHLQLPNANILNLLTFLNFLLSSCYLDDTSQELLKLKKICKRYFLEPLPIGGLARDIMIMIENELKYPNYHIRRTFENTLDSQMENSKVVHILFNKYASMSQNINRFNLKQNEKEIDEEVVNTKTNLLLNIFAEHLNKGKDIKSLLKVHPSVMSDFYPRVVKIVNENKKVNMLKKLLKDMVKIITNENASSKKKSIKNTTFYRTKKPTIPSVKFNLIELEKEDNILNNKRIRRKSPKTIYYDLLRNLMIETREKKGSEKIKTIINIAIAGGSGSVQRFSHAYYLSTSLQKRLNIGFQVYLLPLGTNNFLANWLSKNDSFYGRYLYYPLIHKIGIFPSLNNDIIKGGGGIDFNSFEIKSFYSKCPLKSGYQEKEYFKRNIAVQVSEYDDSKNAFPTPKLFMNNLLNQYFQNAQYDLPVNLYTAQCSTIVDNDNNNQELQDNNSENKNDTNDNGANDNNKNGKDMVDKKILETTLLTFCQRLEIGYVPELLKYRKINSLENYSMNRIIYDNQFKYSPINLNISYVPMTVGKNTSNSINVLKQQSMNISVNSLVIKNVSLTGDLGEMIYPSQKYLEVFIEDKFKDKKFMEYDYDQTFRVGKIIIESSVTSKMFTVLLDGEVTGSYNRIVIDNHHNCKNEDDKFILKTMSDLNY